MSTMTFEHDIPRRLDLNGDTYVATDWRSFELGCYKLENSLLFQGGLRQPDKVSPINVEYVAELMFQLGSASVNLFRACTETELSVTIRVGGRLMKLRDFFTPSSEMRALIRNLNRVVTVR